MKQTTEEKVLACIGADAWRMEVLREVRELGLSDGWVCAGFVRACVWDVRHGHAERTPLDDVDVVYYDPERTDPAEEKKWEARLSERRPDVPWSVKNQARMHERNGDEPYHSAQDGIARFPELPTSVAVRLQGERLELLAPWGVEELWELIVRPIPPIRDRADKLAVYRSRIAQKNWKARWPRLTILENDEAGTTDARS
ncbi:hypothetical protein J31TS4_17590 [Paenibacillus sp. J31TS4]|uniref:nucleotidyltransferase family protein n=1 Tax=Paenibacillus sp. J31TS4 TaxID=2807195 RepID=UPI001B0865D1|nr:nucleotidyltransferase family protein [Paenibacillus sp. J31TS4]GIP38479.1 hypothetical protein J31TS4_17590 [Paenibacillus sp. J31TS4]